MQKSPVIVLLILLLKIHSNAQTLVGGQFNSLVSAKFRIVTSQSSLNNYQGELLSEGTTNEKGEFKCILNLSSEQTVLLFIDQFFYRLWVIPNTNLTIRKDMKSGYDFMGQSEKHNDFLYQAGIMMPYKVPPRISTQSFEPERQIAYLDSIESRRLKLFDQMFENKDVSPVFQSFCKAEIIHFSLFNKSQYPALLKLNGSLKKQDLPVDYYQFWNRFKMFDDSCMSNSYHNSLNDFIEFTARSNLKTNNSDMGEVWKEEFRISDSLLSDHPYTMQIWKTHALLFINRYFDFPVLVQRELENYRKVFPSSVSLGLLKAEWVKKSGNTLTKPDFQLKDQKGNLFNSKDLKGKVIYLDFWGSWCQACLTQMPNSAILQRKFKNRDVVFLFIDFYDTQDKWLTAIEKYKLTGVHLKAEKKDEDLFDKFFGIKEGFPRYALIDKNGVLITTSAPHPNDEKLVAFIEEHLK